MSPLFLGHPVSVMIIPYIYMGVESPTTNDVIDVVALLSNLTVVVVVSELMNETYMMM